DAGIAENAVDIAAKPLDELDDAGRRRGEHDRGPAVAGRGGDPIGQWSDVQPGHGRGFPLSDGAALQRRRNAGTAPFADQAKPPALSIPARLLSSRPPGPGLAWPRRRATMPPAWRLQRRR